MSQIRLVKIEFSPFGKFFIRFIFEVNCVILEF